MKVAALLIGLLGSFLVAIMGLNWIDQHAKFAEGNDQILPLIQEGLRSGDAQRAQAARELQQSLDAADKLGRAGKLMAALGGLSFFATFLVFKLPKLTAVLMVAAALAPAVLAPSSLIFGVLLLLSAALAFLAKPRPKPVPAIG